MKKDDRIWFWEEGYHGEEIYSEEFFMTKFKYIHMNPVRAGIVLKEEEIDEINSNKCKYNSIDPTHYGQHRFVLRLFPPGPGYKPGNKCIEYQRQ